MKITVTAQHIRRGLPMSPCGCPLALAIREAWLPTAQVDTTCVFEGPARSLRVALPVEVQRWEKDFDHLRPVAPITFELAIPEA